MRPSTRWISRPASAAATSAGARSSGSGAVNVPAPPRLADFDADAFLRESWQKKPLLIRCGWAEWSNPLDPDELAGLACEEGVEARLVERAGDAWNVAHGAFPEARLEALGRSHWTLLVQAVDQF